MADKKNCRKRESLDAPMCKYGLTCYQKNPEHHRRFRHPSPLPPVQTDDCKDKELKASPSKVLKIGNGTRETLAVVNGNSRESPPSRRRNRKSGRRTPSPVDQALNIKEKFLVEMPPDFFHLWEFCSSFKAEDPAELFSDVGLHLVGPYDVLSKKITNEDIVSDNILRHWRYYYDPPEFQTVLKRDGDDCYHIGYFRDDPSQLPFAVASNSASVGPKFKHMGENIFCALNLELTAAIKKVSGKDLKKGLEMIQERLQKFAAKENYSLVQQTPRTKARAKEVVAKTFHGFGIVVPYDKKRDVGYRSLPESEAKLKSILSKIANCQTDDATLQARLALDEILTDLQFANDECDFGMGLELGIDLFCFGEPCFHQDVLSVLALAYDLLNRNEFGRVLRSHLSDRRKGDKLSILM